MASNKAYIIDYQALSTGEYELHIHLDATLFEQFPESEIIDADAEALISITKHHNFAELSIQITGTATTACDRCLDPVKLPVDWQGDCLIKVTDQTPDNDDPDIIYISPNETTVDLSHYLYESVILSLPVTRAHSDITLCNQDVIRFISTDEKI